MSHEKVSVVEYSASNSWGETRHQRIVIVLFVVHFYINFKNFITIKACKVSTTVIIIFLRSYCVAGSVSLSDTVSINKL